MFRKCLLFLFSIFMITPAFAGEFDKAMEKGYNVFLYLYTPKCKYCTMFSPNYKKAVKQHDGQFVFIKVDASTKYGRSLMDEFGARFVPYVVMLNSQKKYAVQISPDCLMDLKCMNKSMEQFRNL